MSSRDPSIDYRGFDSASGHKYWIDPATGESSWERPAAYAWKEEPSAEHAGHSYYYNPVRVMAGRSIGPPPRLLRCLWRARLARRPVGAHAPARAPRLTPRAAAALQVTKESTWVRPAILGWKARGCRARLPAALTAQR